MLFAFSCFGFRLKFRVQGYSGQSKHRNMWVADKGSCLGSKRVEAQKAHEQKI